MTVHSGRKAVPVDERLGFESSRGSYSDWRIRVRLIFDHVASVRIESKEMMPVWVPGRPRRQKDAEDIARLRPALESRQL